MIRWIVLTNLCSQSLFWNKNKNKLLCKSLVFRWRKNSIVNILTEFIYLLSFYFYFILRYIPSRQEPKIYNTQDAHYLSVFIQPNIISGSFRSIIPNDIDKPIKNSVMFFLSNDLGFNETLLVEIESNWVNTPIFCYLLIGASDQGKTMIPPINLDWKESSLV